MKTKLKFKIGLIAFILFLGSIAYGAEVINMSARAKVGSEEETFIIGFIVRGESGEKVPIFMRGTGPTENVSTPIPDPSISLFKHMKDGSNEVILGNDNWKTGGQMFAISATQIAPTEDQGSALIASVEPGQYSFHMADVTGSGGVGLAEVYEMTLNSIPANLVNADDFNTLLAAITAAQSDTDVASILSGEGPFTLFAPTDAAFAKIPSETLGELLADPELLADILLYHAVVGEVPSSAVSNGQVVMANGEKAILQVNGDGGVIIQGAGVIETDFMASNGIIHVIDSVMLPPSGNENIVEAITAAGNFSTLLQAAADTGAAATLVTEGPFTLFAPTDEAFAALPEGTLESLSNEALLDILLYHVVVGTQVNAADVASGEVGMGNGGMATLAVGDGVTINESNVILTDLFGANGVVHVIDKVLLPPM